MRYIFTRTLRQPHRLRDLTRGQIASCIAIGLLVFLSLFRQNFQFLSPESVLAQSLVSPVAQSRESLAPSVHIRPVSVSVINFTKLAERDAKRNRQSIKGSVLRAIDPVKTIKEVDSVSGTPASEPVKGNNI